MPISAPPWTEFLTCPICSQDFNENPRQPISLACGHTVCKSCLASLHRTVCPFDQSANTVEVSLLPINYALLQLLGYVIPESPCPDVSSIKEHQQQYLAAKKCIEELALFLKPLVQRSGSPSEMMNNGLTNGTLSRPMHRKLVTLVNCQLAEEEGCARVMRAIRSLGERTILEFILLHQNSAQLSTNLWMAVRNRGCQFLGPAMQEDALKYILLALEGGEALSRKVLVLFVVQRLEQNFPHASKTSIGHVVQLLYRASCFKVTKRDDESSLMQLKEQFRTYDALRREHDSQIVQIALEAGLRISPEQWSALLYGDQGHKSHMQSIIDKLQTPESFASSIQELTIALRRSSDPAQLGRLKEDFELLSGIDGSPDAKAPTWLELEEAMKAVNAVVQGLVDFTKTHGMRVKTATDQPVHGKFKTSMCRDYAQRGACPRGISCTFAHSDDELDKYRRKAKTTRVPGTSGSSMVNSRGSMVMNDHQQYGGPPPEHCDSPLENGINSNRNGPLRTSPPHSMTNGQDYPASTNGGYGQLMMRNNNHSNHDMMVQQLRNLNMHSSPSMYSGQENGFNMRNTITSDCLTPPHTSEQSFNYPASYYGRNGYSTMNGGQMNGGQMNGGQMNGGQMNGGQMNGGQMNSGQMNGGQMNGHIDGVTRQAPTRTSPLTIEEASINGLNGVNGIVGLNGVNGLSAGVNGIINGHSEYASRQQHAEEIRRHKVLNCGAPRYRCAAQYTLPNTYSAFPSSPYYQADVNPRYGPVGTRLLPDVDRFAYPPHPATNGRMCAPVDGRLEIFHPSFHPSNRCMWGRSPAGPEDSESLPSLSDLVDVGTSSLGKNDKDSKSCLFLTEDSTSIDEPTFSRPHLSSVSSGVSSGESYGSHSPRSHSPMSSPQQHSPDAWTGDNDIGSSLWSNGDFPPGPYFSPRSEENGLVTEAEVWKPFDSELTGWTDKLKDSGINETEDSAIWPTISTKKRPGLQAVLKSDPISGYWSDPEDQRFKQIKDDEVIARTLQEDHSCEVTPSAPPMIYNNHKNNDNDATIALELQNMENEEHEMKIEKEMKEFEERKVKEIIKMKQEEDDRKMAIRVQNEEGLTFVTDEATIKLHEKLYKESVERMKEQSTKENQEKKDRELAESLVYEDAYKHGILKRPNGVLANSLKYPVKVVPRGTRAKISPSPTYDIVETALP